MLFFTMLFLAASLLTQPVTPPPAVQFVQSDAIAITVPQEVQADFVDFYKYTKDGRFVSLGSYLLSAYPERVFRFGPGGELPSDAGYKHQDGDVYTVRYWHLGLPDDGGTYVLARFTLQPTQVYVPFAASGGS